MLRAVTLVARNNKIAWFKAQGLTDVESGRPMQGDTVFRIMSMTKPVVAALVLMMLEEGKVRLKDPVSKFIPDLGGLRVADPDIPDGVEDVIDESSTHVTGPV